MKRTGRTLVLGCLLLLQPLLAHAQAGGNSLLIPAMGRCTLNTQPDSQAEALSACQKQAEDGDAQAQYQLGNMFFKGEGVPANNVQAYIVLKMAAVNGAEDALDTADEVAEHMQRVELEVATQVLGQIFRNYLQELQSADGRSPFSPLP